MDIDDLISFENENTTLDFKAIQYVKEQNESLIKDVMAMANAHVEGDKYIVIGVKHKSGGDREFLGIEETKFVDSSTYQQLILENIEPNISLDYIPYQFKGIKLGILKISDCLDRPYMMKKDHKKLKKGDCFIRKGSQQSKMERRDFDQIVEARNTKTNLEEVTHLYFSGFPEQKEIELLSSRDFELPSKKAKAKISRILRRKKGQDALGGFASMGYMAHLFDESYENMSIENLQKSLKDVEGNYKADDCYEIFELNAHKLNIVIFNKGNRYLEDCTIEIIVKKTPEILIASKIYLEPTEYPVALYRNFSSPIAKTYPDVQSTEDTWIIKQHVGDIKHQIPTEVFDKDLRISLSTKLIGKSINFECSLFAKNLTSSLQQNLKIKIVNLKEDL